MLVIARRTGRRPDRIPDQRNQFVNLVGLANENIVTKRSNASVQDFPSDGAGQNHLGIGPATL